MFEETTFGASWRVVALGLLGFCGTSCGRPTAPAVAPEVAPSAPVVAASASPAPLPNEAPVVWRVGTTEDYAPFSMHDESGKLVGFDIELAGELARAANAEVRWVKASWPTLQASLPAAP